MIISTALLLVFARHASSLELHVRAGSAAGGDGSIQQPFRKLQHARDHLRQLTAKAPHTVIVHPGTYTPFTIAPEDLGDSDAATISYVALPGAAPVLTGGVAVPSSAFSVVGSGPVIRTDLFAHGVNESDLGQMVSGGSIGDCQHEKAVVSFGGEWQTLALWPNIAGDGMWQFADINVGGTASVGVSAIAQAEAAKRMTLWAQDPDPWIHGY